MTRASITHDFAIHPLTAAAQRRADLPMSSAAYLATQFGPPVAVTPAQRDAIRALDIAACEALSALKDCPDLRGQMVMLAGWTTNLLDRAEVPGSDETLEDK